VIRQEVGDGLPLPCRRVVQNEEARIHCLLNKAPCTPPRRPLTPPLSSPAQSSSPLMTVNQSKARPRKKFPRLTMTRWWPMAEKDKQLYRQSHPDFVFPIVDKPWKDNHSLATVEKVLEEQKQWRKKRSSNARHDNDRIVDRKHQTAI